jgi:hypothetical protein
MMTPPEFPEREEESGDYYEPGLSEGGRIVPKIALETGVEEPVLRQVMAVISRDPNLFQANGALVQLTRCPSPDDGHEKPPAIRELHHHAIRQLISRYFRFTKPGQYGNPTAAPVPEWLTGAVCNIHNWPDVNPLVGLVAWPAMRRDGSFITRPGYDARTGLYYTGDTMAVPECPTEESARRAVAKLLDLVKEFPFCDEAHRMTWLAYPLTIMARHAVDKSPLFVFDAPTPGTGKTLLADIAGLMVTGRNLTLMCPSEDDEENRKRITTMMLDSVPACLIDNVVGSFGGASFDAALTATEWTDRILGASRRVTLPNNMTWAASGNNMTIKGDMGRRVIICRVDPGIESPDKRTFSRTENELREEVIVNRREYLEALMTILRFGVVSEKVKMPMWGSFERWSEFVRKPLVTLGLPDPEAAREAFRRDSDVERETRVALLRAVRRMTLIHGECTARTMLQVCDEDMKELAAELAHCAPKAVTASKLGLVFKKMNGRSFDGLALSSRLDRLNVKLWSVTNEGSDE